LLIEVHPGFLRQYGDQLDEVLNLLDSLGYKVSYYSFLHTQRFGRWKRVLSRYRLMEREFQERFRGTIRWVEGSEAYTRFTAWMRGKTGYPIVDAAMLQLARAGYMHNRARMIVASVLTKNLGVDWRWGQEYFRAMLLDLDEASNNGGWQWGASVGADPKPIRIFNPYLQAENYDPDATYQKQWLAARYGEGRAPLIPHPDARADALRRYGLSSKSTTE
jgi:deoxyribodipyrimidine photolyase